jgi:carbonic anhydrase/acetyltransferase-like protein (isoleucine patch superfamily)
MGAPAKIVRELDATDRARLRSNTERYLQRAQRYLRELRQISPLKNQL